MTSDLNGAAGPARVGETVAVTPGKVVHRTPLAEIIQYAAVTDQVRPEPVVIVPAAAVHDGAVFVYLEGKAVRRPVKTGATSPQGIRVEEGLVGGEDLITNPPSGLKDGDKVRQKA